MPPVTSELPVDGASVTTFDRFGDSRGYFNELYNEQKYDESLQKEWKQVSFSSSQKHAMRGLHCSPHGKFITCVRGAFYDVIADFREDSPTFGRWCGVVLTEHNKKQVYVPPNCGHGFFTFEDNTCALYLQQGCFNPANEKDNHPLDPMFNVQWPVPQGIVPEMSGKDIAAPTLNVRRPHLTGMKPRGRILIIGASGQVGGALMEAFGPENCIGTYTNTKIKGMVPFDMAKCATNPQLATDLIEMVYPTAVLICAGFTWVDGCEDDQLKANYMNNAGPATVAAAAAKVGARTVWYSTDYVFDGGYKQGAATSGKGPYSETDSVAPLNVYGASKLQGEKALLAADPTALAIRTNVVYGPEGVGKNFVYQLAKKLSAGEAMNVPSDQVNTPTYNRDLATATKMLLESGASGLYNIGGSEVLGRTDFGHAVIDALNARPGATAKPLDKALIKPVTTTNAGQAALRPLDSGLKLDKLSAALPGWKPRTVKQAMNDWLDNPMGKPLGQ
jgi:dTDP-4-dehydrorhamnose reductase/dTDP-4-dehydrorhamnose 3,5-epimerase